jgi:hypothetical protein
MCGAAPFNDGRIGYFALMTQREPPPIDRGEAARRRIGQLVPQGRCDSTAVSDFATCTARAAVLCFAWAGLLESVGRPARKRRDRDKLNAE